MQKQEKQSFRKDASGKWMTVKWEDIVSGDDIIAIGIGANGELANLERFTATSSPSGDLGMLTVENAVVTVPES